MSKVKITGWVSREDWDEFIKPKSRKWSYRIRIIPEIFRYPFKSIKNFWEDGKKPVKVEVVIREVKDE